MYIIIDNYDSFTYNVFQYLSELTDKEIKVFRNDEISIEEIRALKPEGIVISPGPGRPEDAGISEEVIKTFMKEVPILGVCLGHQAIGHIFGGNIINSKKIMHGKRVSIDHDNKTIFRNIGKKFSATRYNSLVVEPESFSDEIEVSAIDENGEIMGLRHKEYPLEGVQFHPESIASESGYQLLKNFLNYKRDVYSPDFIYKKLLAGEDLSVKEAEDFADELTDGAVKPEIAAGILTALNMKGIKAQEIAGVSKALRKKCKKITYNQPVLDTCGTGGDGLSSFNISSMSAIVTAACGVKTAKHGNRSVSSSSGSADFYKEFGIPVESTPAEAVKSLDNNNFCFMFAPLYHSAMKNAAAVRRALGVRTVMNLAGPLSNPASADFQLIGVFDPALLETVAEAARELGVTRVLTVHGRDGSDELSLSEPTDIVEIINGSKRKFVFNPAEAGIPSFSTDLLAVNSAVESASIAEKITYSAESNLKDNEKAVLHAVCLNAGAALYTAGSVSSIADGYKQALKAFADGKVAVVADNLRRKDS